jgi:hypothetical protein
MDHEQRGNLWIDPQISRLAGAVKLTAPAGTRLVDPAAPRFGEMRAASVDKWQNRVIVEEHAAMAGAARPLALDAWEFYHSRRANSAAFVIRGWCGR